MDSAFKTAAFPGMTTARLIEAAADPETDMIKAGAMRAEIDRRAARDAGDVSVMTEGERLRFYRETRATGVWKP